VFEDSASLLGCYAWEPGHEIRKLRTVFEILEEG
jgi:hypothetical protein